MWNGKTIAKDIVFRTSGMKPESNNCTIWVFLCATSSPAVTERKENYAGSDNNTQYTWERVPWRMNVQCCCCLGILLIQVAWDLSSKIYSYQLRSSHCKDWMEGMYCSGD
jgi:hypothetical protein